MESQNQMQSLVDAIDPEIMDTVVTRREAIAKGASVGATVATLLALGSVPIAIGALSKEAYGQTPTDVLDVLQFALLLEQLEADFYTRGVAASGLIPAADLPIFQAISAHETAHVAALKSLITSKGGTPGTAPTFDYTAKGNVPGFNFGPTQYATFQVLAHAFEDTGVRAYKGQAGRLINDKAVLTAALTIHSVEARHASEIRRLRGKKGWITQNSRDDLPAFTQGIYDGEENTTHAGVNFATTLGTSANGGTDALTAAFDEPLTKAQVTAIIQPFLP
jgi:hypothetical protein